MSIERERCIRNHVLGVLAVYYEKGMPYTGIGKLADSIMIATLEADRKWREDNTRKENDN